MIQEFKEFINRGNLIDLAVAFVLGTAFATLVAVFIETMIDPLLGYITPGDNLASWTAGPFLVGAFILGIIAFLAIALDILRGQGIQPDEPTARGGRSGGRDGRSSA